MLLYCICIAQDVPEKVNSIQDGSSGMWYNVYSFLSIYSVHAARATNYGTCTINMYVHWISLHASHVRRISVVCRVASYRHLWASCRWFAGYLCQRKRIHRRTVVCTRQLMCSRYRSTFIPLFRLSQPYLWKACQKSLFWITFMRTPRSITSSYRLYWIVVVRMLAQQWANLM